MSEQYEARRQAAQARWAARFPVARGTPAIPGMSPVEAMVAAGEGDLPPSVFTELLEDELAAGKGA